MSQPRRVNYLNNKDILKEIHKSKLTYCYVQDEMFANQDIIVNSLEEIDADTIATAKKNKASKLATERYQAAIAAGGWEKKIRSLSKKILL